MSNHALPPLFEEVRALAQHVSLVVGSNDELPNCVKAVIEATSVDSLLVGAAGPDNVQDRLDTVGQLLEFILSGSFAPRLRRSQLPAFVAGQPWTRASIIGCYDANLIRQILTAARDHPGQLEIVFASSKAITDGYSARKLALDIRRRRDGALKAVVDGIRHEDSSTRALKSDSVHLPLVVLENGDEQTFISWATQVETRDLLREWDPPTAMETLKSSDGKAQSNPLTKYVASIRDDSTPYNIRPILANKAPQTVDGFLPLKLEAFGYPDGGASWRGAPLALLILYGLYLDDDLTPKVYLQRRETGLRGNAADADGRLALISARLEEHHVLSTYGANEVEDQYEALEALRDLLCAKARNQWTRTAGGSGTDGPGPLIPEAAARTALVSECWGRLGIAVEADSLRPHQLPCSSFHSVWDGLLRFPRVYSFRLRTKHLREIQKYHSEANLIGFTLEELQEVPENELNGFLVHARRQLHEDFTELVSSLLSAEGE